MILKKVFGKSGRQIKMTKINFQNSTIAIIKNPFLFLTDDNFQ